MDELHNINGYKIFVYYDGSYGLFLPEQKKAHFISRSLPQILRIMADFMEMEKGK